MRPNWTEYFMLMAKVAALRSTCLRVPEGVGAVIVSEHNQVLATGYAGSVKGQPHCVDVGCLPGPTGGCIRTIHAEINAITQAAQHGTSTRNARLFCTMSPCWDCMKAIIAAGITQIYYDTQYRTVDMQRSMAECVGVSFNHTSDRIYVGNIIIGEK